MAAVAATGRLAGVVTTIGGVAVVADTGRVAKAVIAVGRVIISAA